MTRARALLSVVGLGLVVVGVWLMFSGPAALVTAGAGLLADSLRPAR